MTRERWQEMHAERKAWAARGGYDLVFIGDSITEAWPLEGGAAWREHFGPLKAGAFGIGGDQTQHVLYRFQQGEFTGLAPKVVTLLIGTNNFGLQEDGPADVLRGIQAVVARIVAEWPRARLLIQGILPSGAEPSDPRRHQILALNTLLGPWAHAHGHAYWDAAAIFTDGQGRLDLQLLPDALHPNALGYARWAPALKAQLLPLLSA
jgi:lysophospholipase L1-like esterase